MIADALQTETITADEEKELIELARERVGIDSLSVPSARAMDARERLIAAYLPAVSATVRRSAVRSKEDLEADLVESLLDLILTHDPARGRLASRVGQRFARVETQSSSNEAAFSIPRQSRDRFYNILFVQAGGDFNKALRLADEHPDMSRDTFLALGRALVGIEDGSDHEDAQIIGLTPGPDVDFERVELVEWLLGHLDTGTRLITELYYGFVSEDLEELRIAAGYKYDEELTDAQIAALEASPTHRRAKVNARRNAGLRIMRAALKLGDPA